MIIKEILVETYHGNGMLSYRSVRGKIAKGYEHLYPSRRISPHGFSWIYLRTSGKWDKKGKQQWVINYNSKGEIIKQKLGRSGEITSNPLPQNQPNEETNQANQKGTRD